MRKVKATMSNKRNRHTLNSRIKDRIAAEWLTPSQQAIVETLHKFDAPPHRVVNIYGQEGTGKSFVGWYLEREGYATYGNYAKTTQPTLPRLLLDDAASNRQATRALRSLVEKLDVKQIILLTRHRVDENAMPAFELRCSVDDMEHFAANLFRHFDIVIPESAFINFHQALNSLT
jgi:hypothetical protein